VIKPQVAYFQNGYEFAIVALRWHRGDIRKILSITCARDGGHQKCFIYHVRTQWGHQKYFIYHVRMRWGHQKYFIYHVRMR
jgi:hypothetical protein